MLVFECIVFPKWKQNKQKFKKSRNRENVEKLKKLKSRAWSIKYQAPYLNYDSLVISKEIELAEFIQIWPTDMVFHGQKSDNSTK